MKVSLIAALARNRVIGKENRLPWHLPQDLKRFRALTTGHAVIMGRKTFESIGKPLPGRKNIVITRNQDYAPQGVARAASLDEALAIANSSGETEAFVIGGAEIYRIAMPRADRLYLTWIDQEPEGDAFFPEWNDGDFRELSREEFQGSAENPLSFSYLLLERGERGT